MRWAAAGLLACWTGIFLGFFEFDIASAAVLMYIVTVTAFRWITLEAVLADSESTFFVVMGALLVLAAPRCHPIEVPLLEFTVATTPLLAAFVGLAAHFRLVRGGSGFDREVVMSGMVCIVTGANTGIGLETAAALAGLGATVVLGCRTEDKMAVAASEIKRRHPNAVLHLFALDLSSLDSVHAFVEALHASRLQPSILVNNAGVLMASHQHNRAGIEMGIATNHLGPFLLSKLLLPTLLRHNRPRIINVGSALHHLSTGLDFRRMKTRDDFRVADMLRIYGDTKLCNMIFTKELHHRYGDRGLVAVCVHPGTVITDVHRDLHWAVRTLHSALGPLRYLLMKSAAVGCQSSVFAATSDAFEWLGGSYIVHSRRSPYNVLADDRHLGEKLWEWSTTMTEM